MSEKLISDTSTSKVANSRDQLWRLIEPGLSVSASLGAFMGIGIAAKSVGAGVIVAIAVTTVLMISIEWNGLQLTLQLAKLENSDWAIRSHPLDAWLNFVAGWVLIASKATLAAVAALTLVGYGCSLMKLQDPLWRVPLALLVIFGITIARLQRFKTNWWPWAVLLGLVSLLFFIAVGWLKLEPSNVSLIALTVSGRSVPQGIVALLQASAILLVAFAGYRQITDLEPSSSNRVRMRSMLMPLMSLMLLYMGVAAVAISSVGSSVFGDAVQAYMAPLMVVVQSFNLPAYTVILAIGAVVGLLGALLSLLQSMAQELVAMAQRREASQRFIPRDSKVPSSFIPLATGGAVAALVWVGNVERLWSFSAFGLLVYYAIIHLRNWRIIPVAARFLRRWTAVNLALCVLLIFGLEWRIWLVGAGLMAVGLIWHGINEWVDEQQR